MREWLCEKKPLRKLANGEREKKKKNWRFCVRISLPNDLPVLNITQWRPPKMFSCSLSNAWGITKEKRQKRENEYIKIECCILWCLRERQFKNNKLKKTCKKERESENRR